MKFKFITRTEYTITVQHGKRLTRFDWEIKNEKVKLYLRESTVDEGYFPMEATKTYTFDCLRDLYVHFLCLFDLKPSQLKIVAKDEKGAVYTYEAICNIVMPDSESKETPKEVEEV